MTFDTDDRLGGYTAEERVSMLSCRVHGLDHKPAVCWSCTEIVSGRVPVITEPAVLFPGTTICGVCGLRLDTEVGLTERCRPTHLPGVIA